MNIVFLIRLKTFLLLTKGFRAFGKMLGTQ